MNREFVLFHLREASEELSKTVREIESDAQYDSGQLQWALLQPYHHLNSAWNGRDITQLRALNLTDAVYNDLGDFPTDFPLMKLS